MDSIKTKSDNYTMVGRKAVAGIVFVPQAEHFLGYVAWEWEDRAKNKFFAISESPRLIGRFTPDLIDDIANYGTDVTHRKEIQKLFPKLF